MRSFTQRIAVNTFQEILQRLLEAFGFYFVMKLMMCGWLKTAEQWTYRMLSEDADTDKDN